MTTEKKYRISIDPRILELLGPSLYTNVYYILAELIANAYDANAKNVYIIQEKGRLIVEDDGHGMSYEDGDIEKYLNVAQETRSEKEQSYVKGSEGQRRKMGRKGVGKLAALSVSSDVDIKTIKDGERSGFVLSRNVNEDRLLTPIPEEQVKFNKIARNGTAVVMRSPQYTLNKTISAIRNNLLKIFPLVDDEFRIHVQVGKQQSVIDSFEKELIKGLGGLITLGEEYESLSKYFDSRLNNKEECEKELLKNWPAYQKKGMILTCKDGEQDSFDLEIRGWIGVYRTTKGRKVSAEDFPDNFISLLSNKKLGEYNILPVVGKNAMTEVYVVGQLHVDLFEETSLPDMALSNRQGYKTDDERYQEVIRYVRNELLPKVVSLRVKYASYVKQEKDEEKNRQKKEREIKFKDQVDNFKEVASSTAAQSIFGDFHNKDFTKEDLKKAVSQAINKSLPDMGIKSAIDASKKKLLISHSKSDKVCCDFIFDLLVFNGVPPEEIIYTSSDNPHSVIPRKEPIFEYLREFFVESYSVQGIYVIYVTSKKMAKSWGAVSEVGAGWITKSEHEVFNVNKYRPEKPLDVDVAYANISRSREDKVVLTLHDANRVVEKIEGVTIALKYKSRSKEVILEELMRIAEVN
ncbi:ATP-binding protein [Marinobacter halodurans]|uniref:ATP-binding protein n=1 Tax=Marinobacter halodurans TaxID=2528979 RepID=A0ABY1ZF16_9GAMM|nr:ATP-binding protein [Marinobacter halodurans]TBW48509.1 ATP-binding protein [Marinobacter halodurans]